MNYLKFSVRDQIPIFDVLSRLIQESDVLDMDEGKLIVFPAHDDHNHRFRKLVDLRRKLGSWFFIMAWSRAVFLGTYATEVAIDEATHTI